MTMFGQAIQTLNIQPLTIIKKCTPRSRNHANHSRLPQQKYLRRAKTMQTVRDIPVQVSSRNSKQRIKTAKQNNKQLMENLIFCCGQGATKSVFLHSMVHLDSFWGALCSALDCLFYRFYGGGRETFRHQGVPFWSYVAIIF